MNQHEYVEAVYEYYRENDIIPGDPNEGRWEEAHYPAPKSLKGTSTILLLKEHHAVQGVLQSEEYQTDCIWGWEQQYLDGEVLELWKKWMAHKGRKVGKTRKGVPNTNYWFKDKPEEWRKISSKAGKNSAKAKRERGERVGGYFLDWDKDRLIATCKKGGKVRAKTLNLPNYYCPITGKIGSAGSVAIWMKARGIDPKLKQKFIQG